MSFLAIQQDPGQARGAWTKDQSLSLEPRELEGSDQLFMLEEMIYTARKAQHPKAVARGLYLDPYWAKGIQDF